jgi:hypothetical protein
MIIPKFRNLTTRLAGVCGFNLADWWSRISAVDHLREYETRIPLRQAALTIISNRAFALTLPAFSGVRGFIRANFLLFSAASVKASVTPTKRLKLENLDLKIFYWLPDLEDFRNSLSQIF